MKLRDLSDRSVRKADPYTRFEATVKELPDHGFVEVLTTTRHGRIERVWRAEEGTLWFTANNVHADQTAELKWGHITREQFRMRYKREVD